MKRSLLRYQLQFFLLALLIPGAFFLWQIWHLLPLFTESQTRTAVRASLIQIASREGWLLSDVIVNDVRRDRVRFTLREHRRGRDPETCYALTLNDSSLHPCD